MPAASETLPVRASASADSTSSAWTKPGFEGKLHRGIGQGLGPAKMTPVQIAVAQRLARKWKPK